MCITVFYCIIFSVCINQARNPAPWRHVAPPPGHVAPHPLPWVFFAPPPMAENPGYAFDHIKGLLTNRFVLQSVLFLVTGGGVVVGGLNTEICDCKI